MDKVRLGRIPIAGSFSHRTIRTQASPSHAHQLCAPQPLLSRQMHILELVDAVSQLAVITSGTG